jgi:hypothetical protein
MPQRNYSRERTNVAKPNKRAILPIGLEEYQELSGHSGRFPCWLDSMIETCPELFPVEIAHGLEQIDEPFILALDDVYERLTPAKQEWLLVARQSAGARLSQRRTLSTAP